MGQAQSSKEQHLPTSSPSATGGASPLSQLACFALSAGAEAIPSLGVDPLQGEDFIPIRVAQLGNAQVAAIARSAFSGAFSGQGQGPDAATKAFFRRYHLHAIQRENEIRDQNRRLTGKAEGVFSTQSSSDAAGGIAGNQEDTWAAALLGALGDGSSTNPVAQLRFRLVPGVCAERFFWRCLFEPDGVFLTEFRAGLRGALQDDQQGTGSLATSTSARLFGKAGVR